MGTFIGHLLPSLSFTLLGLWHTLNTIKSYKLKGPSNTFTSTTWFPLPYTSLKHLELYLILSLSLLAIPLQFSFSLLALEHATMFLHLFIYAAAALATDISPAASGKTLQPLVGVLSASAFGPELFLLHFHSADHSGLEGHYHRLLELVVGVSVLASAAAASFPVSYTAAIVRSAAVMAQGVWFGVMGFVLWVPGLAPEGCYAVGMEDNGGGVHGAVECRTEEAGRRAVGLANLQFSWMIAGIMVFMVCLCLRVDWKCGEYRELKCEGGEGVVLKQGHAVPV